MAGLDDKVEGKAKELQGKLTDDDAKELEGKAQQAQGEVKDTVSAARERLDDER